MNRLQMLFLSHRGDHSEAPENTLGAFAKAQRWGVDGFETDVRVCADGTPILFHDPTARDGRPVSSLSINELSDVSGYEITPLKSALRAYPTLFWNLEIKSAAALEPTLALLNQLPHAPRILITSFLHHVILECARRSPHECGFLIAHRSVNWQGLFSEPTNRDRIKKLVIDFQVMDDHVVQEVNAAELNLLVYGMITPDDHSFVRQLGVAGMITDYLDVAASILKR